jgi:hypothetical protein
MRTTAKTLFSCTMMDMIFGAIFKHLASHKNHKDYNVWKDDACHQIRLDIKATKARYAYACSTQLNDLINIKRITIFWRKIVIPEHISVFA